MISGVAIFLLGFLIGLSFKVHLTRTRPPISISMENEKLRMENEILWRRLKAEGKSYEYRPNGTEGLRAKGDRGNRI
jgi:hypothetical protein